MEFKLTIDGEEVRLEDNDLGIADVQVAAPKAAAAIFYWGSVAAAIRQRLETARSDYRASSAKARLEAISVDPKLAEWKVTAAWEASEGFRHGKAMIEHWQRLYDQASAIFMACQSRASLIQTIYNNERGGAPFAGNIGNETKEASKEMTEAKTEKIREVMRKKRG